MALINCPKCGGTVSDKAVICPHCGWKLTPADQPLSYRPQPTIPQGQPTPPPPPVRNPWPEQGKKSNSSSVIIILIVIFVLAIGGALAWWLLNNKAGSKAESSSAADVATNTVAADVAKAIEDAAREIDSSTEDEFYDVDTFFPPVYDNDFSSFVFNVFGRLHPSGMTARHFSGEIAKSKVAGKQAKYDTYDGLRLQYFFDRSPSNDNAKITGIAISCTDYDSAYECGRLEDGISSRGYEWIKDGMWRAGNGMYISPGFTADRVYAYIYFPNAPDKSSAPRRY